VNPDAMTAPPTHTHGDPSTHHMENRVPGLGSSSPFHPITPTRTFIHGIINLSATSSSVNPRAWRVPPPPLFNRPLLLFCIGYSSPFRPLRTSYPKFQFTIMIINSFDITHIVFSFFRIAGKSSLHYSPLLFFLVHST